MNDDLLQRILRAQIEAGERVVMEHLEQQGLANDYVTVPVLNTFVNGQVIGELRLLRSALPPTPHFHFALGYISLRRINEETTEYKLVSVAVVSDEHLYSGGGTAAQTAAAERGEHDEMIRDYDNKPESDAK